MWFSEYLFLERSWAKDENTLKLWDYPQPFWLALFVEGTRFTQEKLLAAQEYAASAGLPVPKNVLIPRTKGFVPAVSHMRSFVPAIYDATIPIPKSSPAPTMLRTFKGQSSVVYVHIKRHEMKDLPENDDGIAQWCRDIFLAKDKLLDIHIAQDTFGEQQLQNVVRAVKSFVAFVCGKVGTLPTSRVALLTLHLTLKVVASWACVLIFGATKFLQSTALLSSWKGVAISAALLAVVTVLMQILIRFSQSEHSTPAKLNSINQHSGNGQVKQH